MLRLILIAALVVTACARAPMLDGRIVGGLDAQIEDHPHQISFQAYGRHLCGGSLIASNVVLTAAHCTETTAPVTSLSVRAGTIFHHHGGVVRRVKSKHAHPKFDYQRRDYDVSVAVLVASFQLSPIIQLIPLQAVGEEIPDGTVATVTGWGYLKEGGPTPDMLKVVELPKVNHETCQERLPQDNITDRMLCLGYDEGGKDACTGDSGGAAVVDGKQVGFVSWGRGCARPKHPGIFVKVSNSEINQFIQDALINHA